MSFMSDDLTRVFQRATEWLSDLQDGKADSAALFRWLAESPRHVEEFALALSFTDEIAGLTDSQCAEIAAMNAAQRESQTVVPFGSSKGTSLLDPGVRRDDGHRIWLAAAIVLSLLIGGGFLWWDNGWRTYATDFGEQRVVELTDGSVIHLNTESRLKVRYGKASRDIRMITGEALFKAQRDPLHPFRVYAGESVIQAVGTQFNVYRHAQATTVSVLEGSVRITPDSAPVENLSVGQEAQIAPKGRIVTRQIDVRQAAAWRQRRLVFRNDTLSNIAAEFNRYNRHPQIRIEDARAGSRRFAATFDADAPESLVQVLKTNPDLTVEQTGHEITVRSRPLPEAAIEGQSIK